MIDVPHQKRAGLRSLLVLLAVVPLATTPEARSQTQLDDKPQALDRQRTRSEAEQDRLAAAAHYATGRLLFHRGELPAALRRFQRAWRWDPSAEIALADIVPLAFSLDRPDEAVRYALLAAQHRDTDPLLLRRLALYVTESGDWSRAVRLYRKWLSHADVQLSRDRLGKLLVQLEIGRLEYLVDHHEGASKALGEFQAAMLAAGESSSLARQVRRALGDDLSATWELCGLAHLDADQFQLATEALEQIELPLEESGRLGYLKARAAIGLNKPLDAWEHLRDYFRAGFLDDGEKPYALLEQVLTKLNQRDSVMQELNKLRAQNRDNPALALALAREMERQQQFPQAIELYRSVVESPHRQSDAILRPALGRLIALYAQRGQAAEVMALLRAMADRLNQLADLDQMLAVIPQQEGLVDQLVELAQESDEASITGPQAFVVASLLLGAGRYAEADKYYQAALSAGNREPAELALGWGLGLLLAEKYESAAKTFQHAIDNNLREGSEATLEFYLSLALEMNGQTDGALEVARRAEQRQPNSAEIAGRIPWILYHADRRQEAQKAYRQLLGRFEPHRETETRDVLREARFVLSNLAVLDDNLLEGEEWLEQILDEFPEDVGALNDLAYLWADHDKHLLRARGFAEQAVAAQPENAAYRDTLGWVLHKLGDDQRALQELERAVELSRHEHRQDSPEGQADGIILEHLGDVQFALARHDEAIDTWQLALRDLDNNEPQKAVATRGKIKLAEQHLTRDDDSQQPDSKLAEEEEASDPSESERP